MVDELGKLSHAVALTLLKIKLFLDVRALRNSSMLAEKIAQEILDAICTQLKSGTCLANRSDLQTVSQQTEMVQRIQAQISTLYRAVDDKNKYFWPAILDLADNLEARPECYSHGNVEEMQCALKYSYAAWLEISGAIDDVIRDLRQRKV